MGDLDARVATSRMKCKCSGLEAAEFESSPVSNVCMRTLAFVIAGLLVTSFSYAAVQNTPVRECCNDLNKSTVCLTDAEVLTQVKHIEMLPDRMGNRINIKGVAIFRLTIGKNGRVENATAVSGNPLALQLLIGAMDKWEFQPYVRNGISRKVCGQLRVTFSVVQNISTVEAISVNSN